MGYFEEREEYLNNEDFVKETNARNNIMHIENAMRTIEVHKENGIQSKIKLHLSHYIGYPEFNRGFIFMNTRFVNNYVIEGKQYHIRKYHIDHENPDESYLIIEWINDNLDHAVDTKIYFGSFLISETESRSFNGNKMSMEELRKLHSHE